MINDDNIEQNKFSGHGAGSCPAFPNRTPTTDLDHVAGCPRWSLLIIFDIIDSYYDDYDDDPNHVAGCPRWSLLIIFDIIDSYFDDYDDDPNHVAGCPRSPLLLIVNN